MEYKLSTNTWDNGEIEAIQEVIMSDRYTMGQKVEAYEEDFSKYLDCDFAVMTSSGSTANLLMIASLFYTKDESRRLKRGDEVIVPAIAWSTSYFPLQQYGLKLKFIDVDRHTLNINLDSLQAAITDKTKAILAVNLLGNPNDFDVLNKLATSKGITLLEDNCESLGASFNGKKAGTFGLMGTFSSFYSHHIATMEGGLVATDDEELYHILLTLRAHGWTRNLPKENLVTEKKSDVLFNEEFKFVLPGYNVRPLEMSGAVGIEQLKKLPEFIKKRRSNADYFINKFKDNPYVTTQKETGASSWFGFALMLRERSPLTRAQLVEELTKNKIECRPIVTGNFLKNTKVLSYFDYEVSGETTGADYIDKNGLFVGNHQVDLTNEIDFLHKVINNIQTLTHNA